MSNFIKETVKGIAAASFAGFAAYTKILALPVAVLCCAMLADYVTGIAQAYFAGKLSSKTGMMGILKKLCYMFAVVCGVIVDYVCASAQDMLGMNHGSITFFGTMVTVWLILNEVVSILENLSEIGVPLPAFLKTVAEKLKRNIEEKDTE
ncbi:MAG: phage holin family protein [Clostridia bacterium]|nr:phage holin family protein [Clostridia bacterium]